MPESSMSRVRIFDDFTGPQRLLAATTDQSNLGAYFEVGGEGIEDTDAGIARQDTDGLNGVITLTSANVDLDTTYAKTGLMWDVGLMGLISMEVRIRLPDLDTKQIFVGFADNVPLDLALETQIIAGVTTTLTHNGSDHVGFLFSSALTDSADWHGVYVGGTATGPTVSTDVDLNDNAVAGEWQILRLELAPDGTARWYIDEQLVQTAAGAISTTVNLTALVAVSATTTEFGIIDVDYIEVLGNRDWTI